MYLILKTTKSQDTQPTIWSKWLTLLMTILGEQLHYLTQVNLQTDWDMVLVLSTLVIIKSSLKNFMVIQTKIYQQLLFQNLLVISMSQIKIFELSKISSVGLLFSKTMTLKSKKLSWVLDLASSENKRQCLLFLFQQMRRAYFLKIIILTLGKSHNL